MNEYATRLKLRYDGESNYLKRRNEELLKHTHIINGLTKIYIRNYSLFFIGKKDKNNYGSTSPVFYAELENISDFNIEDMDKSRIQRVLIFKNEEIPFEFCSIGGQEQTEFEVVIGLYIKAGLLIDSDLLYSNKFTTMLVRNELKKQKIIEIPRFIMIHTFKFIDNYNLINYYK